MLASNSESSAVFFGVALVSLGTDQFQSPTDFWLDTYSIAQVFDTPDLKSSLASYREQLAELELVDSWSKQGTQGEAHSILLLRVQAAASYYSTNRSLMEYPQPVDVDISKSPHRSRQQITNIYSS